MEDKKTTSEVNLMDILVSIWNWIVKAVKYLFHLIGTVLQLLFKYKILTLIILIFAFAVSQYYARQSNRKYQTGAMAYLYGVRSPKVKQVGNQLTSSSPKFKETSIGYKLDLPDSLASRLLSVEFFDVIDYKSDSVPDRVDFARNHSLTDTLNILMNSYIYVRLTTLGTQNVDKISNAVLNYLNENADIKSDFDVYKSTLQERIQVAELESKRIDSLARKKYFESEKPNIQLQNNRLLVGEQRTQLMYGDLLFLQKDKAETERRLSEAKAPVVLPSGFIINPRPINGRVTNGIDGLIIGIILSVMLAFVLENYKKWLQFLRQK
ncbi:MAG: hypothetical protein ACK5KP_08355 [Paludibacteraceae bacterium]